MSEHLHPCTGLDGSNPLHLLAACGVLSALEDAGCAVRLHWQQESGWHPVITCALDRNALCQRLAEVFLTPDAITARQQLDAALAARVEADEVLEACEQRITALGKPSDAAGKADLKAAKQAEKTAKEAQKSAKAAAIAAEVACDAATAAAVAQLHPVTAKALHLDNIAKGGLSAQALRTLLPGAGYLVGLGACLDQTVKVQGGFKTMLARSALSFSNNNSGKALLKDFAGVARHATPERIADALFGDGRRTDTITGLGWDPASQRSYALQFADPQDLVECQTMHHALAFYGLAAFPVVPTARDRLTTGFITTRAVQGADADSDDEDGDDDKPRSSKRTEWFQWPLWTSPLSPSAVRSVLAMAEVAADQPDYASLQARGIAAVYRARRFSLNKRSYFAPGIPA